MNCEYIVLAAIFIALVVIIVFRFQFLGHKNKEKRLKRAKLQRELEEIKEDINTTDS